MLRTVEIYYFLFMLYSFAGWVWESVFCSLMKQKKLINRGFLNGPYCPVYGCGALLDWIVLQKIDSPVWLFYAGGLLCCALEYVTSFGMEKLFHARWWDYSYMKYHIKGRVCLLGFLAFGGFSVIVVKGTTPWMLSLLNRIPDLAGHIAAALILCAFLADNVVTITGMNGFNEKLKELSAAVGSAAEAMKNRLQAERRFETVKEKYELFTRRLNRQQKRILSAFPDLRSLHYNDVLKELRKRITHKKTDDR